MTIEGLHALGWAWLGGVACGWRPRLLHPAQGGVVVLLRVVDGPGRDSGQVLPAVGFAGRSGRGVSVGDESAAAARRALTGTPHPQHQLGARLLELAVSLEDVPDGVVHLPIVGRRAQNFTQPFFCIFSGLGGHPIGHDGLSPRHDGTGSPYTR